MMEAIQCHKFEPALEAAKGSSSSSSSKAAAAAAAAAKAAENRSTFKCPFCGLKNLDSNLLVKHCNENHQDTSTQVVRSGGHHRHHHHSRGKGNCHPSGKGILPPKRIGDGGLHTIQVVRQGDCQQRPSDKKIGCTTNQVVWVWGILPSQ